MYISRDLSLKIKDFIKRPDIKTRGLLENQTILFSQGREAIYYSLKLILDKKKSVRILLPSYLCSSIFEPILSLNNIEFYFYKLDKKLQINRVDLFEKIKKHKINVLYIIHYFGFVDPYFKKILEFSKSYKIRLIEDAAVSLFSKWNNKYLGSWGDFGIFSLRKYLPIPDGGMLKINTNVNHCSHIKIGRLNKKMFYRRLIKKFILSAVEKLRLPPRLYNDNQIYFKIKALFDKLKSTNTKDKMDSLFSQQCRPYFISRFSKYLLFRTDTEQLIKTRRKNFKILLDIFKNFSNVYPLYNHLPDETCPFVFPFIAENQDKLKQDLIKSKVDPLVLWHSDNLWDKFIDKKEFADSYWISDRILCLPVHHNIKNKELKYMIKVISRILG